MKDIEIKDTIKGYLMNINSNLNQLDNNLIDFTIDEIIERAKLYLNRSDVPEDILRILAKVINCNIIKCIKEKSLELGEIDKNITSISDNGQSIAYSNEITNYFVTIQDNELFNGFVSLLSRYRRINVVHS